MVKAPYEESEILCMGRALPLLSLAESLVGAHSYSST